MAPRRRSRVPILVALLVTAGLAGPPAVIAEPLGTGWIIVHIEVGPYWPGLDGPYRGTIGCEAMPENIEFEVWPSAGSASTPPIEIPVTEPDGQTCTVWDLWLPDDEFGNLGEISGIRYPWVVVQPGAVEDQWVTVERTHDRDDWELGTDDWGGTMIDLFTVDRVQVNRYGGITADGRLWCPSAQAAFPGLQDIVLNVDWTAIQYVGRKTAITGQYQSDIGTLCDDWGDPTAVQRWRTLTMGPVDAAVVWVYGTNGKFASGPIHIEAVVHGGFNAIAQWWDPTGDRYDPTCSTEPNPGGFVDNDGDGFCVTEFGVEGRVRADLKAVRAR